MLESGEFDNKNAAEGENGVSRWMANFTSTDNQACYYALSPTVSRHENLLFITYYCFRIVCVHFLPCTSLVILNSALVGAIRSAQRRRRRLLLPQPNREGNARLLRTDALATSADDVRRGHGQGRTGSDRRRRLPEGSSTTMMLVIVVGVCLLVETPLAVFLVVMIAENTFQATVLTPESRDLASLYLNLFTLVSYPVNFFIYCAMSEQFRRTFCGLFACSPATADAAAATAAPENNDDPGDVQAASPLDRVEMMSVVEANRTHTGVVESIVNGPQCTTN